MQAIELWICIFCKYMEASIIYRNYKSVYFIYLIFKMNHYVMKKITLLLLLFVLLSCSSKKSSEQATDSTAVDSSVVSKEMEDQVGSSLFVNSFDAFVQPGSVVYADSTEESDALFEKKDFEQTSIQSVTTLRYPEGAKYCDQYPWYQVQFPDQSTGWVYGDNILKVPQDRSTLLSSFTYHEKEYNLYLSVDTGIGPSDSEGLTGCNEYDVLYLYDVKNNAVNFIQYACTDGVDFIDNYKDWFSFISSEGGSASVSSVSFTDDDIILNVDIFYQEGGAKATVQIRETDSTFVAESVELADNQPAEEEGDYSGEQDESTEGSDEAQ